MPSPQWCTTAETPIGQALAAAQHEAWHAPEDRRHAVFVERFRQLVGPARAEPMLSAALALFNAQPVAPAGWEEPPTSAYWRACPRCQRLSKTPHTIPQNGRLELAVLRDPEWLDRQFARGISMPTIAKRLKCAVELVGYWAEKHGLQSPRQEHAEDRREAIRTLHNEGRGPGGISRELGIPVCQVRARLKSMGIANKKHGHVYHQAAWWQERVVKLGWTLRACAKEAGIRPNNATYFANKFGLSDITKARSSTKGKSKWKAKYPALADAGQLRALLDHHGTYEAVGAALGCAPSLVSRYAQKLLGVAKRHENGVPHGARAWWTERLDQGMTTWQLAEAAGIEEKSAREKLRVLGAELLAQAYRNNLAVEKARRAARTERRSA